METPSIETLETPSIETLETPSIETFNALVDDNEEMGAELIRHHRDFERISSIIETALKNIHYMSRDKMVGVLLEIREIVK